MIKRKCDRCNICKTIHFFTKTEWNKESKKTRLCSSCRSEENKGRRPHRTIGKGNFKEFYIGKGKA